MSDGQFERKFFRWRVRAFRGRQGTNHDPLEVAHQGRRQHLFGFAQPRGLRYGLSASNGGSIGGEGRRGAHERRERPDFVDGTFLEGSFLRLRQAGTNQPDGQALVSLKHRQEGRSGRNGHFFHRLGRKTLLGPTASLGTKHF